MANLYSRLIEAFKTENAAEIGRQLKIERQSVYRWRDGKNDPSIDTLLLASEVTGASLHWLLTGEGPKQAEFLSPDIIGEDQKEIIRQIAQSENKSVNIVIRELIAQAIAARGVNKTPAPDLLLFRRDINLVPLPLIGSISASQSITYYKERKQVLVADTFIQAGSGSFVLQVVGNDWASEGFVDGDMLICSDSTQPENGQVVVASFDGQAIVKRWFAYDGVVRLQPANGKGDQAPLPRDRVKVVCVVVGVQRTP